jgi:hypothetical protein
MDQQRPTGVSKDDHNLHRDVIRGSQKPKGDTRYLEDDTDDDTQEDEQDDTDDDTQADEPETVVPPIQRGEVQLNLSATRRKRKYAPSPTVAETTGFRAEDDALDEKHVEVDVPTDEYTGLPYATTEQGLERLRQAASKSKLSNEKNTSTLELGRKTALKTHNDAIALAEKKVNEKHTENLKELELKLGEAKGGDLRTKIANKISIEKKASLVVSPALVEKERKRLLAANNKLYVAFNKKKDSIQKALETENGKIVATRGQR